MSGPDREIAVGVRYVPSYPAPMILFKAQGHLARRVRELAQRYGIPETADETLAPLLFQLPEGSWIPETHFAVIAELLTAVYHYSHHYESKSAPSRKT